MAAFHIVFRAACSRAQGTGHLRRCLTLAQLMADRGWQVLILTDENDASRAVGGLQKSVSVEYVPEDVLIPAGREGPTVLVVDMPVTDEQLAIHPEWVRVLRALDGDGTAVISLGHVSSNSGSFRAVIDLYPSQTVHAVNYFEGPEYLILRPEFGRERASRPVSGPLLVSMGGSDPFDLTRCAIESLASAGYSGDVALVLGAAYTGAESALTALADQAGFRLQIHRELATPAMAALMKQCSLGLVAFGTTAYEMMALGRPALVFAHYRWQEASACLFERLGALHYLGCGEDGMASSQVGKHLDQWLEDAPALDSLAQRGPTLIDGQGASRVADILETYGMETQQRKLDVLFVVAHPGDELLGAGATLLRLVRQGKKVGLVVLGEGVASRWSGEEHDGEKQDARQSITSALQRVVDRSGLHAWYYYRFEDNRFDRHDLLDLVKVVEAVIDRHQPHTVYTHHPGDMNVDHRLCFDAVMTAARPQHPCSVKSIFSIETPSSTDWGQSLGRAAFIPNWFEPVDSTLDDKLALLEEYGSELRAEPHPRSLEAIRDLAGHWGRRCGVEAAEAFVLQRHIANNSVETITNEAPGEAPLEQKGTHES